MKQEEIDISVIIGFKDWGVERLLLSVQSIIASFGDRRGEVIVSDFGSEAFARGELRNLIEIAGAVYARTETDGTWSRSRAINAGYAVARGSVVVATDADMLFTPNSMRHVANAVLSDPTSAVVLQCRDLPEGYDHHRVAAGAFSFDELHQVSQIRPRWGMGGMFAAHRNVIAAVGGYDNRMHTYGGEDLDLAVRVRKSGRRIRWIEHDEVRMYHIWHEPTIKSVEQDEASKDAVQANRAILQKDPTWKRNVSEDENKEYRVSWAQCASTVITPDDDIRKSSLATFTIISPAEFTTRLDHNHLVAQQLDVENRALMGQIIALETPKSRTAPNWDVDFRLPILAFDSRFAPLVSPYFENGNWDILGAARRLQAASVSIWPSSEVFGVIDRTPEMSKLAQERNWEWSLAAELYPKEPGPRGISDLIKNLPVYILAQIMQAIDIKVFSTSIYETDKLKSITDIATEWSLSRNLLTGDGQFEAIIINASEPEVSVLRGLESRIDIQISQIPFGNALTEIERLTATSAVVKAVETIRANRDIETGAVQVSWIDNPQPFDDSFLINAHAIGGDFVEVQNEGRRTVIWVGPRPLIDVEGNAIAPIMDLDFFADWNTGLFGPLPLEKLVALEERLQK